MKTSTQDQKPFLPKPLRYSPSTYPRPVQLPKSKPKQIYRTKSHPQIEPEPNNCILKSRNNHYIRNHIRPPPAIGYYHLIIPVFSANQLHSLNQKFEPNCPGLNMQEPIIPATGKEEHRKMVFDAVFKREDGEKIVPKKGRRFWSKFKRIFKY